MQPRVNIYVLALWYKPHRAPPSIPLPPSPPPKKKKAVFDGVVYMSAKENLTSEQDSIIMIAGLAVKLF